MNAQRRDWRSSSVSTKLLGMAAQRGFGFAPSPNARRKILIVPRDDLVDGSASLGLLDPDPVEVRVINVVDDGRKACRVEHRRVPQGFAVSIPATILHPGPGQLRERRARLADMDKVNLSEKLQQFTERWSPRVVGELNGQQVKLAKLEGSFVWHHHEREDELFLVLRGRLSIHLRDRVVELAEGEFFIVPRGVEHKPVADSLCHVMLFEPAATRNTGEVDHAHTIEPRDLERI